MFDFEFNGPDMLCQDSHRDYTSLIVQIEEHPIHSTCPHCAAKMYRHGRYTRKLKDVSVYPNTTCMLSVKVQRYRYLECGFTLEMESVLKYCGENFSRG